MNDLDKKSEFEQLIERNRRRLLAIARTYARGDAEDLLQEILLQVWRSMSRFEERSSIDTWCYRIALNTAISWRRKAGRRKERLPTDGADLNRLPGPEEGHNATVLLHKFLQTLSDADRALVLMYLEDMSGEEMADVLGIQSGALRVRLHRIKQRLAQWEGGDA